MPDSVFSFSVSPSRSSWNPLRSRNKSSGGSYYSFGSKFSSASSFKSRRFRAKFNEDKIVPNLNLNLFKSNHFFQALPLQDRARHLLFVNSANSSAQLNWKEFHLDKNLLNSFNLLQSSTNCEIGIWKDKGSQSENGNVNIIKLTTKLHSAPKEVLRVLACKTQEELDTFFLPRDYPSFLGGDILLRHDFSNKTTSTMKRLCFAMDSMAEARDVVFQDYACWFGSVNCGVLSLNSVDLQEVPEHVRNSSCKRAFFSEHCGFIVQPDETYGCMSTDGHNTAGKDSGLSLKINSSEVSKVTLLLQLDLGNLTIMEKFLTKESLVAKFGLFLMSSLKRKVELDICSGFFINSISSLKTPNHEDNDREHFAFYTDKDPKRASDQEDSQNSGLISRVKRKFYSLVEDGLNLLGSVSPTKKKMREAGSENEQEFNDVMEGASNCQAQRSNEHTYDSDVIYPASDTDKFEDFNNYSKEEAKSSGVVKAGNYEVNNDYEINRDACASEREDLPKVNLFVNVNNLNENKSVLSLNKIGSFNFKSNFHKDKVIAQTFAEEDAELANRMYDLMSP